MPPTHGDTALNDLADKANYERLQKDVHAVKNDIAALTDQITDVLNAFAGQAGKQARSGYRQARENMDQTIDDMSERGGAMFSAAQDAANSLEERLEDVISQRPLATVGLALGLGFLIRGELEALTWRKPMQHVQTATIGAALGADLTFIEHDQLNREKAHA